MKEGPSSIRLSGCGSALEVDLDACSGWGTHITCSYVDQGGLEVIDIVSWLFWFSKSGKLRNGRLFHVQGRIKWH